MAPHNIVSLDAKLDRTSDDPGQTPEPQEIVSNTLIVSRPQRLYL